MFVASKHYKVLCHESCYHVKNIKEENKITFQTFEEGMEYCSRVCKSCKAMPWNPKKAE